MSFRSPKDFPIRPSIKRALNERLLELLDSADEFESLEAHNELVLRLGGWFYLPYGGHYFIERPELSGGAA